MGSHCLVISACWTFELSPRLVGLETHRNTACRRRDISGPFPPLGEEPASTFLIVVCATLELEGQTLNLKPGDSWLVPAGAAHHYTIIEPLTAVEATAPPAEVHGRDTPE
jgi:hypothetical protein